MLMSANNNCFFIVSLLLAISFNSQANDQVTIGSNPTPGLIQTDGNGLFNKLNRHIFAQINQPMNLSIKPIRRTKREHSEGLVDAYFPELWEKLSDNKADYVVSDPIFYKKIILFTRKDSQYQNLDDLKNKAIGAVDGFSYGKKIINDAALDIHFQRDDQINIRLLSNKRLEAVLGGFPGTVLAVNQSKYKHLIQYDIKKPVAVLESFYVCQNNQKGKQLCSKISEGIQKLKELGILTLDPTTGYSKFDQTKLK